MLEDDQGALTRVYDSIYCFQRSVIVVASSVLMSSLASSWMYMVLAELSCVNEDASAR